MYKSINLTIKIILILFINNTIIANNNIKLSLNDCISSALKNTDNYFKSYYNYQSSKDANRLFWLYTLKPSFSINFNGLFSSSVNEYRNDPDTKSSIDNIKNISFNFIYTLPLNSIIFNFINNTNNIKNNLLNLSIEKIKLINSVEKTYYSILILTHQKDILNNELDSISNKIKFAENNFLSNNDDKLQAHIKEMKFELSLSTLNNKLLSLYNKLFSLMRLPLCYNLSDIKYIIRNNKSLEQHLNNTFSSNYIYNRLIKYDSTINNMYQQVSKLKIEITKTVYNFLPNFSFHHSVQPFAKYTADLRFANMLSLNNTPTKFNDINKFSLSMSLSPLVDKGSNYIELNNKLNILKKQIKSVESKLKSQSIEIYNKLIFYKNKIYQSKEILKLSLKNLKLNQKRYKSGNISYLEYLKIKSNHNDEINLYHKYLSEYYQLYLSFFITSNISI